MNIIGIFGLNLSNQDSLYLMTVLTLVFGLVSGILAYFSLKMAHAQHGHDDEEHH